MNKQIIAILSLFVVGALISIFIKVAGDDYGHANGPAVDVDVDAGVISQVSVAHSSSNVTDESEPIQALEDKVAELEARILELEQKLDSRPEVSAKADVQTSRVNVGINLLNRMLTTKSLVKAGISEEMAADLVRRRNGIELSKLELHDRATRKGYIGTTRYSRELSDLMAEETTLREDLGDESYDRYLFANKRPNRVKATSVMQGSAAEQAGMKDGDLILTYGELRVFEWGELKRETSKGELGEYVNVNILRDGQQMSLWIPRGPLGVRLGFARVTPN